MADRELVIKPGVNVGVKNLESDGSVQFSLRPDPVHPELP